MTRTLAAVHRYIGLFLCLLFAMWFATGVVMLFSSLLLYSAFTTSRGTQTQAIIADATTDADRDAAFSMYFLLGFISQPFWVMVTGYLMDKAGFATALTLLSTTYIIGIIVLSFMKDERPRAISPAA